MTPSHLTLSDLERSNSRSLRFQSCVSYKGAELGHMLSTGKQIWGSIGVITFVLE